MARQHMVGQGLFTVKASRSYSDILHSVEIVWTSDQPDAETPPSQNTTLTNETHPCPPVGFEPTISANQRPQNRGLDGAASGIG